MTNVNTKKYKAIVVETESMVAPDANAGRKPNSFNSDCTRSRTILYKKVLFERVKEPLK